MSKIKDGEYILATRFSDGDPMDPWCFGFLIRQGKWYTVVDENGAQISGVFFTRAQRISKEFGHWLSKNIRFVESSGRSLWWWKANYQKFGGDNDYVKSAVGTRRRYYRRRRHLFRNGVYLRKGAGRAL